MTLTLEPTEIREIAAVAHEEVKLAAIHTANVSKMLDDASKNKQNAKLAERVFELKRLLRLFAAR